MSEPFKHRPQEDGQLGPPRRRPPTAEGVATPPPPRRQPQRRPPRLRFEVLTLYVVPGVLTVSGAGLLALAPWLAFRVAGGVFLVLAAIGMLSALSLRAALSGKPRLWERIRIRWSLRHQRPRRPLPQPSA